MVARTIVGALLSVAVFAGCASRTYVRIAEGLTAPTPTEAIRVAPRMFTPSELAQACQDPRPVARLQSPMKSLDLQVGERFALSELNVVAVNFADVAMGGVPIVIEASEGSPPVLQLRSDDRDLSQGRIYSLNSGTFQLRIRTICSGTAAQTTVVGRVGP
jgi:hypothetical protein